MSEITILKKFLNFSELERIQAMIWDLDFTPLLQVLTKSFLVSSTYLIICSFL